MTHLNVEIKARTSRKAEIKAYLEAQGADFKGIDHQEDTYFQVPEGRLKLREGNIENSLIFYRRTDQKGPKDSHVSLYHPLPDPALKAVLSEALGVKKVVKKSRAIYFIDNVKFHLDEVEGLGQFVEIEAIDLDGNIGRETLLEQCEAYLKAFGIGQDDLMEQSYSDMV
jgi:adenylate cyclase class 2